MKTPLVVLFACLSVAVSAATKNLVDNPSFESGSSSWQTWLPPDREASDGSFTVIETDAHTGASAARLITAKPTRFTLLSKGGTQIRVKAGQRYRVSFWYRGEAGSKVSAGAFGMMLRCGFVGGANPPSPESYYCAAGGASADLEVLRLKAGTSLPLAWTQMEFVFDVMQYASQLNVYFTNWGIQGAVQLDDIVIESVDNKVPLTVLKK